MAELRRDVDPMAPVGGGAGLALGRRRRAELLLKKMMPTREGEMLPQYSPEFSQVDSSVGGGGGTAGGGGGSGGGGRRGPWRGC